MGADPDRQKTYASGCHFRLPGGLIELVVDAVPVRRKGAKDTGVHSVCPNCEGHVNQQYVCDNKHGPFTQGQLAKSLNTVDASISSEEQEALKGDFEAGVMDLVPTKLSDILASTRPDDTAYRLRPGSKGTNFKLYGALRDAVVASRKKDVVLLGEYRPTRKDTPRPFILETWGRMLVVQSLIRPDDLADFETVDTPDDKAVTKGLVDLLTKDVHGFDAEEYRNRRREAMAELAAAKAANPDAQVVALPKPKAKADDEDLLAALTASLAS